MSDPLALRALVIGLDGATFRVLRPMAEAGELPNLERLMRAGAHGVLRSTIQPSSEQAWPAFFTGVQNGKHGIFGFVQRVPGTYETQYVNARLQRAPTLWRILSERGRRVLVVNVPITYPPEEVNGVLISGLMTPSERSRFTHPPHIYEELRRAVGGYTINVDIETGQLKDAGEEALLNAVEDMVHLRTKAVTYLAQQYGWDFLCVVYGAADRVSHKFWRYMDDDCPTARAEGKAGVIPRVYRMLDEAVGELLDALAGPNTLVLILSDHGFSPLKKAFFLNQWLAEQGYLVSKPRAEDLGTRARSLVNAGLRRAVHWLDRPWMAAAKRAAFAMWPALKGKLHSSMAYAGVDWSRTRAYAVGTMGNIYLNVRGREPQGIVEMGAGYEALRDEIIAGLKSLRDPESGAPIFLDVYRREEIYHGPYLEEAPDIVGLLDPTYHVAAVDWRPADGGVIESLGDKLLFVGDLSGQHDLDGILLAQGPHVRTGERIEGARIIDLAPTILAAMGEPVPAHMDGRVLDQLFDTPPAVHIDEENPTTPSPPAPGDAGYSEDEEEEIASRLRGLGYIE